jgi:hypothetical protein
MATTVKKSVKKIVPEKGVVVSKKVKDYRNEPYFEKKAKEMEALLNEYGLPESKT